jgi:LacI family transcriptional regulator
VEEDIFSAGVELTKLLLRRIAGEPAAALQSLAEPKTNWKS